MRLRCIIPTLSSWLLPSLLLLFVTVIVPACVLYHFTPDKQRLRIAAVANFTSNTCQKAYSTPGQLDFQCFHRVGTSVPSVTEMRPVRLASDIDECPPTFSFFTMGEHSVLGLCHALSASLVPLPLLDFPSTLFHPRNMQCFGWIFGSHGHSLFFSVSFLTGQASAQC